MIPLLLLALFVLSRRKATRVVLAGPEQDTDPATLDYYDRLQYGGVYAARPGGVGRGPTIDGGGGGGGGGSTSGNGRGSAGVSG